MKYQKSAKLMALGLIISANAFAVCDRERAEREQFKHRFDAAAATATASCAAGSFFTIITFGASLIPCATAGLAANNQKRILDEKEANLQACENEYLRQQQLQAQREIDRKARIDSIQQAFNVKRDQITREFETKRQQLIVEFETSGYDPGNPDVQAEIKEKQEELQKELNQALDAIESERSRALAGV